jgi:hypothetical protein
VAKIQENYGFDSLPDVTMRSVKQIAVDFGWRVLSDEENKITIKENHLTVHTYNAVLSVSVSPASGGSNVLVEGSIYGVGPQKKHLKGQMGWFINALKLEIDKNDVSRVATETTAGGFSVADELMKLNELRSNGILTDAEFAAAKTKLI